jgi:stage III sporulation protein SpoIIIAA
MAPEESVTDNIEELMEVLPARARGALVRHPGLDDLLEVVIDLGRPMEARFPGSFEYLTDGPVTTEDIAYVVERVGHFDRDSRAGIERTLHRISAIRNRVGEVVGLTCRVGRAVYGTIDVIRDVVTTGHSILMLGRPGVGKTTKLREVARVLADEFGKRVIVVDTNNEIAGDGDIPHPAIGRARRMQVPNGQMQHDIMIQAVENHMPEVIVIDEIGTDADADAARTIAERGVQLVGTAHGNRLENLMQNPTLADLIGGIQAVTLGDDEARRRGTQKTVLERKAPPTFDTVIEIEEIDRLAIHHDVARAVDLLLLGAPVSVEVRHREPDGGRYTSESRSVRLDAAEVGQLREAEEDLSQLELEMEDAADGSIKRIFPVGVTRRKLEKALRDLRAPFGITRNPNYADIVLAVGGHLQAGEPLPGRSDSQVVTIRSNTFTQIHDAVRDLMGSARDANERFAVQEAERAVKQALNVGEVIDLLPQNAYVRRLQHEIANNHSLHSESLGREPRRHVRIMPP